MPMHDVGLQVLYYVAALLNLVFSLFFRLMSPLSKDETGRGCSPVQFLCCCDLDMLADWRCFFLFHLIRYGFPPGGAISLVPLWFPWWFCSSWQSTWGHYSFVLLTRNTRLGVMPMHDVGLQVLFSVAALLNLVFSLFFRLMTPLSKDETGRGCSLVQFLCCCDLDMLADRRCFFLFI